MVQRGLLLAAMLLACLSLGTTTYAGEADLRALMERVQKLEAKNAALEAQVHRGRSVTTEVDKAISRSDATMGHVITGSDPQCRPLRIGGYFDVSYEYNFNRPDNQNNNQRIFDRDSNGFNVHAAELNFDRLPTKGGEAGFRMDIAFGTDQNVYRATDNYGLARDSFGLQDARSVELQQAYLSYIANIGNGITFDAGKYVTWSGAEVIEAADNINASRSILFGAIPFTHTGIRATYPVLSEECGHAWTIGLSVQNGWDNIQDQNESKTVGFLSNLQVTKWFNWVVTAYAGNEGARDERALLANQIAQGNLSFSDESFGGTFPPHNNLFFADNAGIPGIGAYRTGAIWDAGDDGDARLLVDTVMTFTPWEKLTLQAEGVYLNDEPGSYWGVAGYAKWQFHENWYLAARGEYFDDKHGVRLGRRQVTWEGTLTLDWKLSDPLHIRFEYRHDDSNVNTYADTKGVGRGGVNIFKPFRQDSQDTVMMQWVYKF